MIAGGIAAVMSIGLLLRNGDDLWGAIKLGMVVATMCGFAYWLAWGGARVYFRLLVVSVGVFALCLILGISMRGNNNELVDFAMITLGTAAVVTLPRLIGVRRCRLDSDGLLTVARGRQFSLRDIFIWTTTAAFLAAVVRWSNLPSHLHLRRLEMHAAWSLRMGSCTLLAAWAFFFSSNRIATRFFAAAILFVFISEGIALLADGTGRDESTLAVLISFLVLSAVFYFLRRRGVRLAFGSSIRVTRKAEASSNDSPFKAD
jgi:hypothetical protein